jgi:hypothetical protein
LTPISMHNAPFILTFGKFQNPFFVVLQRKLTLEGAFKLKSTECCLTRTCSCMRPEPAQGVAYQCRFAVQQPTNGVPSSRDSRSVIACTKGIEVLATSSGNWGGSACFARSFWRSQTPGLIFIHNLDLSIHFFCSLHDPLVFVASRSFGIALFWCLSPG